MRAAPTCHSTRSSAGKRFLTTGTASATGGASDVGREGGAGMGRKRNRDSQHSKSPRRIVAPMPMGRLLDPDVSQANAQCVGREERMVPFPCGVVIFTTRDGRIVRARAPQRLSVSSCARITLDAAADAIESLQERVAQLEELVLANNGEGAVASRAGPNLRVVRHEVCDEDASERALDDGTSEADVEGKPVGTVDCD